MKTIRYTTKNPYEDKFGYSRAIRRGPFIFVSGTTALDPESGEVAFPSDAYAQAVKIFNTIINTVKVMGGSEGDIMRVRMFVTEDGDGEAVGRALKDTLGGQAPAATMIMGANFIRPEMKVEIEADAYLLPEGCV